MGEGGYRQINKTLNACAFEEYLSTQQKVLPRLENVEQISPRVIRVLGQNAGKVIYSPHSFGFSILLALACAPAANGALVHITRNKHIYRRDGLIETHHRHWPRHSSMGGSDLFYPDHVIHRLVSRVLNPLAR